MVIEHQRQPIARLGGVQRLGARFGAVLFAFRRGDGGNDLVDKGHEGAPGLRPCDNADRRDWTGAKEGQSAPKGLAQAICRRREQDGPPRIFSHSVEYPARSRKVHFRRPACMVAL
jgi:hypothetical protein